MENQQLRNTRLADLFRQWPETAVIFQRRQMACPGCVVAPFYTVAEAARIYNLDEAEFLQELQQQIKNET